MLRAFFGQKRAEQLLNFFCTARLFKSTIESIVCRKLLHVRRRRDQYNGNLQPSASYCLQSFAAIQAGHSIVEKNCVRCKTCF